MAVPYTFGTATAAIPLSQLDSNFATAITLGNTAVYLGNTTTSIGNLTLTNVTISSGSVTITDTTVSGNVTLSGGTANGVAYLNGSKVLTTGSALTFNGTNFGVGGAALEKFAVVGTTSSLNVNPDSSGTVFMYAYMSNVYNPLRLDALNQQFYISGSEQMRLTNTGLVIGGTSPSSKLHVAGAIRTTGSDSTALASSGVVRYVAGTTMSFVSYGADTSTPGAFNFTGLSRVKITTEIFA